MTAKQLIPNIWKNEEKGRGTRKALAAADVWVPLCLSALGAGEEAWNRRACGPASENAPVHYGERRPKSRRSEGLVSRPGRPGCYWCHVLSANWNFLLLLFFINTQISSFVEFNSDGASGSVWETVNTGEARMEHVFVFST